MAVTLQAQRLHGEHVVIDGMADVLIETWGYESAWRIAREVSGDVNYWERVVLVIKERISE